MKDLKFKLFKLIGKREKAQKRWDNGDLSAEKDYRAYKKDVEDLIKKHPEIASHMVVAEDYFNRVLCSVL